MEFIDLTKQQQKIRKEINLKINKVLNHGKYIMGPEVQKLEKKLAQFTKSKYCITVGSGTEALLISLMSIGLKRGDEVITSPFSWASSAEVIALLGAKPVFVDIEDSTCNIDTSLIESRITKKTKAIIPISLFGQTAKMKEINKIAKKYKLYVIEDAAQSFGATYNGNKSCNISKIGCTSFFPSKPLGCYGDGGAIFTNDSKLANICRQIRLHGQSQKNKYVRIGINGRMDTLQCAIVLEKFKIFPKEIILRQKVASIYDSLMDEAGIKRLKVIDQCKSVYSHYTIFISNRDKVKKCLQKKGIPTAIYYGKPLNEQIIYSKICMSGANIVAKKKSKEVLSLPMSPYISKKEQKAIFKALKNCIDK